ncbi:ParB N-terminal domain-containing protein [Leucobacter sp. UT-8R-CII-1-4]|uniref:ParB N-terminal domain-containing protein n=1 Tax=Leucobacter sp. UT-8R-CII-1-4 TaxID=3040075 RepID=UPI0024A87461|nr:ParB N-terminal domain-containing protein [Leucobacter sp. UT-8R-CII-1-4]MDI6022626.1 ParB N-terminal domain-containing protein [Leucobacter sp. UT-8R-CII-1-4]
MTSTPQISQEWAQVRVNEVIVKERQRAVDQAHVAVVAQSFREMNFQIQPIVVDEDYVLVDGAHRLQAAKNAGWETIGAMVVHGATDEDRPLIELEANRLRKQMSPAEVYKAWKTYGLPVAQVRAKSRQIEGGIRASEISGFGRSNEGHGVTVNSSNSGDTSSASVAAAAKQLTGMSLDSLNKIEDIHQIAESSSAPEPLRTAALTAIKKLEAPEARVDALHKNLLKIASVVRREIDPGAAHLAYLENELGGTLTNVALLEQRLDERGLDKRLRDAARSLPLGAENLRTIRMSLAKSLAIIIAVECLNAPTPTEILPMVVREVTQALADKSADKVGQVIDHE